MPGHGIPPAACEPEPQWGCQIPTGYKPTQVTHILAYPRIQGVIAITYPVVGRFSTAP